MSTTLATPLSTKSLEDHIVAGRVLPEMNFNQKVWALCARIPEGKVVRYADIAVALESRGYRAVGNALNRNPYAPRVPCHRVVGSTGALTGFASGVPMKRQMLESEGIVFRGERVDLTPAVLHSF